MSTGNLHQVSWVVLVSHIIPGIKVQVSQHIFKFTIIYNTKQLDDCPSVCLLVHPLRSWQPLYQLNSTLQGIYLLVLWWFQAIFLDTNSLVLHHMYNIFLNYLLGQRPQRLGAKPLVDYNAHLKSFFFFFKEKGTDLQ